MEDQLLFKKKINFKNINRFIVFKIIDVNFF